jgi:phosphatidylinositol phospholipase C delta
MSRANIWGDFDIPEVLRRGTSMTKVSSKKYKRVTLRLDPGLGQLIWRSKLKDHRSESFHFLCRLSSSHIFVVPIENIKELRSGTDTRYYREQFQLAQEYEDRWLTVVYVLGGAYKTLHVISATRDEFKIPCFATSTQLSRA